MAGDCVGVAAGAAVGALVGDAVGIALGLEVGARDGTGVVGRYRRYGAWKPLPFAALNVRPDDEQAQMAQQSTTHATDFIGVRAKRRAINGRRDGEAESSGTRRGFAPVAQSATNQRKPAIVKAYERQ